MEQRKRGLPLTLFAIAFGLLAISDFTKPFSQKHDPQAGLVFFGTKLTGTADVTASGSEFSAIRLARFLR